MSLTEANEQRWDERRLAWLGAGAIILLTMLVYMPVWFNGFVWDDDALLNPLVKSPEALKGIWLSTRLAITSPTSCCMP
jgi:hypothetical protein